MTPQTKGLIATFFGVLLMSFESLFVTLGQSDGATYVFYFGLCIFVVSTLSLLACRASFIDSLTNKGSLLAGICMALSNFAFVNAVVHVGIANTVLLLATIPIFSALFGILLLNIPTPTRLYAVSFFVVLGSFVIVYSELSYSGSLLGNLYALACPLFTALTYIILRKYPDSSRWGFLAIGGGLLAGCSAAFIVSISYESLFFVVCVGVFITPLSRVLIAHGAKYILPAQVGLMIVLESVFAPIWGWMFLDIAPTNETLLGGALILSSIVINSLYELKRG